MMLDHAPQATDCCAIMPTKPARSGDLALGEAVCARAKLTGNGHAAVRFTHVRELRGTELAQVNLDAFARAAARRGEPGRARYDHALFVEQPVEQPLRRKYRIEQLVILNGGGEETGAVPVFLIIVLAPGRGVVPLATHSRQLLDHQATGTPVPGPRAFALAAPVVSRHGQTDEGRQ